MIYLNSTQLNAKLTLLVVMVDILAMLCNCIGMEMVSHFNQLIPMLEVAHILEVPCATTTTEYK